MILFPPRFALIRRGVAFALLALFLPSRLLPAAPTHDERALQAAIVLNFARFVTWPDETPGQVLPLVVLGDAGMVRVFSAAFAAAPVRGRPVTVMAAPAAQQPWPSADLVFQSAGTDRPPVAALRRGVLWVSATGDPDAHIVLWFEEGKPAFSINRAALERDGLRASSKLLRLAR